ncbi:MAG: family 43 glycosylhydrolase [Treponema sp.]|nr:family 43 glycosylhydrolase [Treponema sp.]
MTKQGFNPFLPSWEYIPDGEPHVFNDRVYVYGSHDKFDGYAYCMNDYVCWSAPLDDLKDWRYEGIIFKKTDDPYNKDGSMHLYAPDVTQGPDGRYYLYYVLDKMEVISVAVCDSPAGRYEFFGFVRYENGRMFGRQEGDVPQFDPAVFTEGNVTYLYSGQCSGKTKTVDEYRNHSIAVILNSDMLTISQGPFTIIPGIGASENTSFKGHEFFEASSIRKIGDTYYFIYSSFAMNELCYATSKSPVKDFKFGGVIVSNADLNIDTYKPANKMMYHGNNNHGSIAEINGQFYIFYHRHTNGNEFSRQACLEKIYIEKDGSIKQVEMTSCGPNNGPLAGKGEYPAYIACNIFSMENAQAPEKLYWPNRTPELPFITQDCKDGDEDTGFVTNILDNCGVGFKYFNCRGIRAIRVKIRGYCRGFFEIKTSWDGQPLGTIGIVSSNVWKEFSSDISIPDGVHSIYFIFRGTGNATLGSFTLV